MTVSKAWSREAKHDGADNLRPYLASLVYLRQEAKRDGLDIVAEIMWDALVALEKWLDTGKAPVDTRDILDLPLCHSLDFLLKLLALNPAKQRQVAHNIAKYEEATRAAEGKPRSHPRTNKRIAS